MDYISFTLWIDGSSFMVCDVEEDSVPSIQPHLTSVTTPEPDLEPTPTSDHETQLLPALFMPEPMPVTEPQPASVSVQEEKPEVPSYLGV